jgi:ubiquinone/menaquinone biosynthesis C-methylase UbiE
MPTTRASDILDQLTALSDPTRCRILRLLEQHELTVGELCISLQLPQSTVSRHLKALGDENWVSARGEGTSRFYKSSISDNRRAESAVAKRRAKVRLFFDKSADLWDDMRAQLVGERTDLLALLDLLDPDWVVGDLGCGTGHISEALSPAVGRVIAVDESGPMLAAARARLQHSPNVDFREGHIEALPLDDASLDVAILFLVAHFISDPAKAMQEVRRVLKPGGRLLIVDLTAHDRAEYVVQLGHIWQGFDSTQVTEWLSSAGFDACRYRLLANDGSGRTPRLFVASARRPVV